jgi:hypothetical protein
VGGSPLMGVDPDGRFSDTYSGNVSIQSSGSDITIVENSFFNSRIDLGSTKLTGMSESAFNNYAKLEAIATDNYNAYASNQAFLGVVKSVNQLNSYVGLASSSAALSIPIPAVQVPAAAISFATDVVGVGLSTTQYALDPTQRNLQGIGLSAGSSILNLGAGKIFGTTRIGLSLGGLTSVSTWLGSQFVSQPSK